MKTYRLDLSYDGTAYSGWQSQKNALTIEDTLKDSLDQIDILYKNIRASGRTDAGVHATQQVVSFKADTTIPADRLIYALNRTLPEDIRVTRSLEVPDDFDAHRSAIGKAYSYYINLGKTSTPFQDRYSWHIPYHLERYKVFSATSFLEGKHDFVNFRTTGSNVKTTVREVYSIRPYFTGNFLKLEFVGEGFLYNMVRILTGTIVEFANNKISTNRLHQVFKQEDRSLAGITAPANGLFLDRVFYTQDELEEKLK